MLALGKKFFNPTCTAQTARRFSTSHIQHHQFKEIKELQIKQNHPQAVLSEEIVETKAPPDLNVPRRFQIFADQGNRVQNKSPDEKIARILSQMNEVELQILQKQLQARFQLQHPDPYSNGIQASKESQVTHTNLPDCLADAYRPGDYNM